MQVEDSLAAWMLDNAVTWFGITIENALHERVKVTKGTSTESRPRYTLARLLDPTFRLPPPELEPSQSSNPWAEMMMWSRKKNSGIRRYKYVA